MGQRDCLLFDSDDSDIPDLDLPVANARKEKSRFFMRARQNVGAAIVKQQSCRLQTALILLLAAVVIAVAFLGCFTSYIWSQLEQLRKDSVHDVVTRELEITKCEVNKIKLDLDLIHLLVSSSSTPIWNSSSLLQTRLEHIESQISGITDKVQEKVNAVADACNKGCEAVSKLLIFNNLTTTHTLDSTGDKLKKKRSKMFTNDELFVKSGTERKR